MDAFKYTITAKDFDELDICNKDGKEYFLLDVRDAGGFSYGAIPGAVNIPEEEIDARMGEIPKDKTIIVYCKQGISSKDVSEKLREQGYSVLELHGGYMAWLVMKMQKDELLERRSREDAGDETYCQSVEKSIRKKFHKSIFSKFAKAINTYDLLQPGDKVAVCISGGKDSMLMAKLFQELKRHNKFDFELVFLVMDPGYNEMNRKVIETNASRLEIPITIFESPIFNSVYEVEKSPCYLCARMRRGYLYSKAKELGCNKIALGHHYDDVIETILMGMLYGGQVQTMMPKLHSTNFEGMELIRPMYLIREEDIKHWRDYNDLHFIQCACRFTDDCTTCRADGSVGSKRMEIKNTIREMKKINPYVEANIFKSVENVNLNTIIAYKKQGITHHFLDSYNNPE